MNDAIERNSICPVCGKPVSIDLAPIEYYTGAQGSGVVARLFRVCSPECGQVTARDPQRYHAAAEVDAVATHSAE